MDAKVLWDMSGGLTFAPWRDLRTSTERRSEEELMLTRSDSELHIEKRSNHRRRIFGAGRRSFGIEMASRPNGFVGIGLEMYTQTHKPMSFKNPIHRSEAIISVRNILNFSTKLLHSEIYIRWYAYSSKNKNEYNFMFWDMIFMFYFFFFVAMWMCSWATRWVRMTRWARV